MGVFSQRIKCCLCIIFCQALSQSLNLNLLGPLSDRSNFKGLCLTVPKSNSYIIIWVAKLARFHWCNKLLQFPMPSSKFWVQIGYCRAYDGLSCCTYWAWGSHLGIGGFRYVRTRLAKQMQLRSVPEIRFYHDDAAQTGEEVTSFLLFH